MNICMYIHKFISISEVPKPLLDLSAFENEWMEIELQGCNHLWIDETKTPNIPTFLREIPSAQSWADYSQNSE